MFEKKQGIYGRQENNKVEILMLQVIIIHLLSRENEKCFYVQPSTI